MALGTNRKRNMLADLWQDLRYGARMLLKRPVFTSMAVLTLGLGIGANTAIFSLVDAVVLRPLPFKEAERLVWIWATRTDRDKAFYSIPNFIDTRDRVRSFDEIGAFANWGVNLTAQGEPERLQGIRISAQAFQSLGVVGNVKHVGLSEEPTATLYGPLAQIPSSVITSRAANLSVVARGARETPALAPNVRRESQSVDPQVPASNVRTMSQFMAAAIAGQRFNLLLLGVFAGAAMLLAAAGIYGVMAYTVARRTPEIGLRLALGAHPRDALRLVSGQGMKLALTGIGLGMVGSLALTRLLASLLYGVSATDPLTFVSVALLLLGVARLACYLPARRAALVDPIIALRSG